MRERSGFISSGSAKGDKHPVGTIGRIRQKDVSRGVWVRRSRSDRRAFGTRNKNQAIVMRWSMVFSLAALGLILCIFVVWAYRHSKIRGDEGYVSQFQAGNSKVTQPLPEIESKALACSALTVGTIDAVTDYFHLGNQTPEQVMAFLAKHVRRSENELQPYWLGVLTSNGQMLDLGMINIGTDTDPDPRLLILTQDESNTWKLDFEAFARTTTPSWPEILENPQQGGTVRVILVRDNYYNGPFNEREWECYRLLSPEVEKPLFGYSKRDSVRSKAIHNIGNRGIFGNAAANHKVASEIRATLQINQPEGAYQRQFEITRVLAGDWVATDKIYEDTFRGLDPNVTPNP